MEIAKGIKSTDYKNLDLTVYTNKDWDLAIQWLDKRLTERYLDAINVLMKSEDSEPIYRHRFGFTILAIDCLLIETLQSFYEGITDSTGKSNQLFTRFLLDRTEFSPYFQLDSDATMFYKNFRCGILHQGQTFGNTLVRAIGSLMVTRNNGQTIVNRKLFHSAICKEKDNYISALARKDNPKLLDAFRKKMDYICQ